MSNIHELKIREILESFSNGNPKSDAAELYFCCPECGCSELSVTYTSTIELIMEVERIYQDGSVEIGEVINDEIDEVVYVCMDCESALTDDLGHPVRTRSELAKWIEENCEQDLE